jgi:hypothetical protein
MSPGIARLSLGAGVVAELIAGYFAVAMAYFLTSYLHPEPRMHIGEVAIGVAMSAIYGLGACLVAAILLQPTKKWRWSKWLQLPIWAMVAGFLFSFVILAL